MKSGLINELVAGFADVVQAAGELVIGRTALIYQAGFADDQLEPIVDVFHLGPLHVTQTSTLDGDPHDKVSMVPANWNQGVQAGAHLTLRRPPTVDASESIGIGAVVSPFPTGLNLNLFKLTARFQLAETLHGGRSACVVVARKGGIPDTVTEPARERIAVTLHSAYDTKAREYEAQMNTPSGGPIGTTFPIPMGKGSGQPVPGDVRNAVYSTLGWPSVFELELLVDRRARIARAGLTARHPNNFPYVEKRWFVHELVGNGEPITAVGFGLSIPGNGGDGPVAVNIIDFKIHVVRRGVVDVFNAAPFIGSAVAAAIDDMRA